MLDRKTGSPALTLLAGMAALLCLIGCGDGDRDPFRSPADAGSTEPPAPQPPGPAAAAIQGYVVGGVAPRIDDAVDATDPGAGAMVSVYRLDGELVGTATAGADGFFSIGGALPGVARVEACLTPGCAAPDATDWVTVYAGATIVAGQDPQVSRAEAVQIAIQGLPAGALAVGSMQPLVAGTVVEPANAGPADPLARRVLPAAEWFFFLDHEPMALFEHPVEFLLVDATTGAVTTTAAVQRPLVNGRFLWGSDVDIFAYEGVAALDDVESLVVPLPTAITPSPEIAQQPDWRAATPLPATRRVSAAPPQEALPLHNTEPESIFVIIIQGDTRSDFDADRINMRNFFQLKSGVPLSNIRVTRSIDHASREAWLADYMSKRAELETAIKGRLTRDQHSTLIFVATSHGLKRGLLAMRTSSGRSWRLAASQLDPAETKACRVRAFVNASFAWQFGNEFHRQFADTPVESRPDLAVYCSSLGDQSSGGLSIAEVISRGGPPPQPGSLFLNGALQKMSVHHGDIAGLLDAATPHGIRSDLELWWPGYQDPVAIVRESVPAYCVLVNPTVTLDQSVSGIPADGVSRLVLTALVWNSHTGNPIPGVQVTFRSSHGALVFIPPGGDANPAEPGPQVTTDANGIAQIYLRSDRSDVDVWCSTTATIPGSRHSDFVTFFGFSGTALQSVTAYPSQIDADGLSESTIEARVFDTVTFMPAAGARVDFTATLGRRSLTTTTTDAGGVARIQLTSISSTTTVTSVVTATHNGMMDQVNVDFLGSLESGCSLEGDWNCSFAPGADPCVHDPTIALRSVVLSIEEAAGALTITGSNPSTIPATGSASPDCMSIPSATGQGTVAGVDDVTIEWQSITLPTPDTISGVLVIGTGGLLPGGCSIYYAFLGDRQ